LSGNISEALETMLED